MSLVNKLLKVGFACWFAVAQVMLGMPAAYAQDGVIDVEPPLIEHDIISAVEADIRQSFFATVVDDNELDSVSLFYRFAKDPTYSNVLMKRVSYSSTFIAHVPTDATSDRNIEYYIQARDKAGNRTVRGYAFNPLVREITVEDAAATPPPVVPVKEEPKRNIVRTAAYVTVGIVVLGLVANSLASSSGGGGSTTPACDDGTCPVTIIVGQP